MHKTLYEYGFPCSLSSTSKEDVFEFISKYNKKDRSGFIKRESGFKIFFPELYQEFLNFYTPKEWPFFQRLYHFLLNDVNLKLGQYLIHLKEKLQRKTILIF